MIDKENGIPYYRQLMQIIQQQVASGCLKEEAQLLRIPANMPVLRVYSLLKSRDDLLIQYTIGCYRADLAKISVEWQESDEGRSDQRGKKAGLLDQSLLAEGL